MKQMLQALRMAKNPQTILQSNPQYKQVMDYISKNGGDPKAAFYKMAEEKGINPEDILCQLR
jgi:hypothetical protein